MAISKKITDAITQKAKASASAPANVFSLPEADIKALGYKEIHPDKSLLQVGDIVSLSKDRLLWLILDNTKNFRKTMKEPADKIMGPIYRK